MCNPLRTNVASILLLAGFDLCYSSRFECCLHVSPDFLWNYSNCNQGIQNKVCPSGQSASYQLQRNSPLKVFISQVESSLTIKSTNMSLSIGVEIEGVALRRATSSAPFPLNSDHQLRLIVDELERNNLPARVYVPSSTRGTGPNYSVWNVTIDATVSEVTSGSRHRSICF